MWGLRAKGDDPAFQPMPSTSAWVQMQRTRRIAIRWKLWVWDDRGVRRTMVEGLQRSLHRKICYHYMNEFAMQRPAMAVGFVLLVVLLAGMPVFETVSGLEFPGWLVFSLVPWTLWLVIVIIKSQAIATLCAFLHRAVCPSCEYPLVQLTPESDGCSICPECGGAWRLPATPGSQPDAVSITSEGSADSHR